MTFAELYEHLAHFVADPDLRWKHVMRVKRSLDDPNDYGGNAKDQCYFEGKQRFNKETSISDIWKQSFQSLKKI